MDLLIYFLPFTAELQRLPKQKFKWYLHYGENRSKLACFKEQKYIFCTLKRASLER